MELFMSLTFMNVLLWIPAYYQQMFHQDLDMFFYSWKKICTRTIRSVSRLGNKNSIALMLMGNLYFPFGTTYFWNPEKTDLKFAVTHPFTGQIECVVCVWHGPCFNQLIEYNYEGILSYPMPPTYNNMQNTVVI